MVRVPQVPVAVIVAVIVIVIVMVIVMVIVLVLGAHGRCVLAVGQGGAGERFIA